LARIRVDLDPDSAAWVEAQAKKQGKTPKQVVNEALGDFRELLEHMQVAAKPTSQNLRQVKHLRQGGEIVKRWLVTVFSIR